MWLCGAVRISRCGCVGGAVRISGCGTRIRDLGER